MTLSVSTKIWLTVSVLLHLGLAIGILIVLIAKVSPLHLGIPTAINVFAILSPFSSISIILLSGVVLGATQDGRQQPFRRLQAMLNSLVPVLPIFFGTALVAASSTLLSPAIQSCSLTTTWRTMFMAKEASAIRGIQDALSCCGFRSPQDQAFPFPDRTHNANACVLAYGARPACAPMLETEHTRALRLYVGVGVFVLLSEFARRFLAGWDSHPRASTGPRFLEDVQRERSDDEERTGLIGRDVGRRNGDEARPLQADGYDALDRGSGRGEGDFRD